MMHLRFAGFPMSAWTFALRNWLAMTLALLAAFWLQLESASSAAVCVGILSLQTRGQAFQKAAYRMCGTVVGVAASLVIAGIFSQTRGLFFLACCTWLGLCAMLASLLDGNRAYGVILSGYTVAIVAIPNVDTPLSTLSSGVNRGAAIAIGILAVALVNELFGAPDLFPDILRKMEAARRQVRAFATEAVRRGNADLGAAAALMREITALHPDISALPSESVTGRARALAASTAVVSLLRQLSAARVASASLAALGPEGDEPRAALARCLEGQPQEAIRRWAQDALGNPDARQERLLAAGAAVVLFERECDVDEAFAAMRKGRFPLRPSRMVFYKSGQAARRNGLRIGLALAISSFLLSLPSWPATTATLVQIGALGGLSATNPNPRGFAVGALIAMPLAALVAGVTKFLVLDGVDQFQLLALAMAPTIIAASLMLSAGNPRLYGVGFLLMVYFPFLLSPSNPQDYNPQSYIFASFLTILAVVVLFLLLSTLLPNDARRQRGWILGSARRDLDRAIFGRPLHRAPASVSRDADRTGQLGNLGTGAEWDSELLELFRLSDLASCARRIRRGPVVDGAHRAISSSLVSALRSLDPVRMRDLGRSLIVTDPNELVSGRRSHWRAGVDLLLAATLIEHDPRLVAELKLTHSA